MSSAQRNRNEQGAYRDHPTNSNASNHEHDSGDGGGHDSSNDSDSPDPRKMSLPDRQVASDRTSVPSRQGLHQNDESTTDLNDATESQLGADDTQLDEVRATLPNHDWDSLIAQYRADMDEIGSKEAKLLEDFHRLTKFFDIWVKAGSSQETLRDGKRLATRIRHVQESEMEFANNQVQYNEAVTAMQRALDLLGPRQ